MPIFTRFFVATVALTVLASTGANYALAKTSVLSAEEITRLQYGQQEERLARDVYLALADQYQMRVFANIAKSENQHVKAVGNLLTQYGLPQTTGYGVLQATYEELITKGRASLKDALEVGETIEKLDIADLQKTDALTTQKSILQVFRQLERASNNHLRAFTRNLERVS